MSNQATMPRGNCLDWRGRCVNLAHSRPQVYEGKRYVLATEASYTTDAISRDSGRGQLLERYLGLTELTGRMETQVQTWQKMVLSWEVRIHQYSHGRTCFIGIHGLAHVMYKVLDFEPCKVYILGRDHLIRTGMSPISAILSNIAITKYLRLINL